MSFVKIQFGQGDYTSIKVKVRDQNIITNNSRTPKIIGPKDSDYMTKDFLKRIIKKKNLFFT